MILGVLFVTNSLVSCKDDASVNNPIITQQISSLEQKSYKIGDVLEIKKDGLLNISDIKLSIDGKSFPNGSKIDGKNLGLGKYNVTAEFYNGTELTSTREFSIIVFANEAAQEWTYDLVTTYPHNPDDFTQGFYYKDGYIFEGTGLTGKSRLVKYKLGSTEAEKVGNVDTSVFGEGITELDNTIYQLTWQNRLIFTYDQDLKMKDELAMPGEIREGWGITTMNDQLVVTEGSQKIHFFTKDLKYIRTVQAVDDKQGYSNLNELDYHDGLLYINVYQQNFVIVVDPETGAVKAKLNLDQFKPEQPAESDVLNGIAFKGENMLVTGKLWNRIYEIKLKK